MCGIVGALAFDGSSINPRVISRMADVARHRGPDDRGIRAFDLRGGSSEEVGHDLNASRPFGGCVGFNRLSILDLSANGHQPMVSDNGKVFITFNGEVYNAFDHRPDLESKGYRFRSNSDTEVLLYLYQEYGIEGMLERLNGMFAFAVVDLAKREVHIARDHIGIKPLYYMRVGETLLWASEIKSLLEFPGAARELDPDALDEQLLFRYTAGERTPFRGIKQLRPGFRLAITPNSVKTLRYWEIPDREVAPVAGDVTTLIEKRLEDSVRSQLISDVKLGCQLSGGIDSSLVTAMARDRFGADLESFSITFAEQHVSEERWIREAAAKTQTTCHTFPLTFEYFFDNLERATWHMDYPLNLANAVGLKKLAEESKKRVTVLLSGDGADEVYGGYPRFFFAATRDRMMPAALLCGKIPGIGAKIARNYNLPPNLPFSHWFVNYSASMRFSQLKALRPDADFESTIASRLGIFEEGKSDRLANCLKYESQTFMVELLIRQDKMMMAHSVENRVPMLDRHLVELSRSLPRDSMVDPRLFRRHAIQRGTKVALKKMAAKRFGDHFAYRTKEGFGLPLLDYFRRPEFEAYLREQLIPSMSSRGWMRTEPILEWHKRIQAGDWFVVEAMWTIVSLEVWARVMLGRRA
ncbi:MAG: asparagine synthase (glutamine-hydrolyzing) [Phycisphaerales bacterium]